MSEFHVRAARPDEAAALSELALRSKAHWGYDITFLEACREELAVDPAECDGQRLFVAERDATMLGYYLLRADELTALFVDRPAIGTGAGRVLFEHAVGQARRLGMTHLDIEADPGAEPFYLRMGARRIGEVPSGSVAGRVLPLLRYELQRR